MAVKVAAAALVAAVLHVVVNSPSDGWWSRTGRSPKLDRRNVAVSGLAILCQTAGPSAGGPVGVAPVPAARVTACDGPDEDTDRAVRPWRRSSRRRAAVPSRLGVGTLHADWVALTAAHVVDEQLRRSRSRSRGTRRRYLGRNGPGACG